MSDSSVKRFRYFGVDGSIIMAILERAEGADEASRPSLAALMRGPSGRRGWTLQLRLRPTEAPTQAPCRLFPECNAAAHKVVRKRRAVKNQPFPENMDEVPVVKADLSVPDLREIVTQEMQQQLQCLQAAFERQRRDEAQLQGSRSWAATTACRPPRPVASFQSARLFLSNLGLLTPEMLKMAGPSGVPAQLVSLDPSLPGFLEDLRQLDQLPSTHRDSAFVFCMRAGQRTAAEILNNVESSSSVPSHFLDFLSSLGRPVKVERQLMGGVSTDTFEFPAALGDSGGGVFNGERFVLMYADALTELTFIVPSSSSSSSSSSSHTSDWLERPAEAGLLPQPTSNQQVHSHRQASQHPRCPAEDKKSKLLLVWIERSEDTERFPLSELLAERTTHTPTSVSNVQLVFIQPLKTGFYRIFCKGNTTSKFGLVVPLVGGTVVSKRCLGFLVRETVINCCRRRQLESDSAPLPHVRRKHAVGDIIQRYRSQSSGPTFCSALFQNL